MLRAISDSMITLESLTDAFDLTQILQQTRQIQLPVATITQKKKKMHGSRWFIDWWYQLHI